ncbi:MAG: type I glyceraldehyde-3-phosphate dehydrogenase [Candidatus Geothermarchaeales archaeon]
MSIKVGINGFGRIGRLAFRAALDFDEVEVLAINDLADTQTLAFLLKYDSVFGKLGFDVEAREDAIVVDGREVKSYRIRSPAELPWKALGVEVAIESTGIFRTRDDAKKHLDAGAKKVLVSAPMGDPDATLMLGINEETYDPGQHHVLSMASCTTNAVVPVLKVLNDEFGIVKGVFTTVHAYTNDQRLLDAIHRDPRRSRAAALNIIPTTTGAARAVAQVLPELEGKLEAMALRVPVPDVSLIDAAVEVGKKVTVDRVNASLREASEGPLEGLMEYVEEPLVSQDFMGNPALSIVDGLLTSVVGGDLVKVVAWYDNEWGYSVKLIELIAKVLGKDL